MRKQFDRSKMQAECFARARRVSEAKREVGEVRLLQPDEVNDVIATKLQWETER